MKRNIFFSVLIIMLLSTAGAGFAAETGAENAADKMSATLETSPSPSTKELPKDKQDAPKKDDLAVNEAKAAPIATVSPVVKDRPVQEEANVPKAAPALNTVEMQQRWKSLFSKEITQDSIAYTVKSGDSLYVLARKNHTTVDLIKKINGLKSDNLYPKMKLKIHTAPFSIRIDKSKNLLVLYSKGEAVKKYSVATGKKNSTPVGEFKITDKLVNPTWFKTGAILPPGSPQNALGTRWMGFDKPAYGIHGTIEPKSIGSQASEGCIRMLNEEVEELYSLVPVGTKVTIQD